MQTALSISIRISFTFCFQFHFKNKENDFSITAQCLHYCVKYELLKHNFSILPETSFNRFEYIFLQCFAQLFSVDMLRINKDVIYWKIFRI